MRNSKQPRFGLAEVLTLFVGGSLLEPANCVPVTNDMGDLREPDLPRESENAPLALSTSLLNNQRDHVFMFVHLVDVDALGFTCFVVANLCTRSI